MALAVDLVEPIESARAAGLRYVSDLSPGIRRKRAGKGFMYRNSEGRTVNDDRMVAFAAALPEIRERTDRDLERPGMPREKVLAAIVRLLEETRIRVGNEEYRKENGSFGLTTLRNRHVEVIGSEVHFSFRGKSGKLHRVDL